MRTENLYLCITPFFPSPGNWRGAYVLDQVKAIARNSEFKVVVFKPCSLFKKIESYECDGITVHSVPSLFMPSYFFNGFGGFLNGTNLIKKLKRLNISIDDIAVCHCHTAAFACFATALKKKNKHIKTILQYHDLDPYQVRLGKFANWRPNLTYRVKKFTSQFKYIDLHLCISQRVKYNLEHFPNPHPSEYFEPYLSILNSARHLHVPKNIRTYVLYNGVDVNRFYPIDGISNTDTFKIGCVSNFNDLKGHITLIKAVEILVSNNPEAKILVSFVGSGETKVNCQKYIEEHKLSKHFVFEKEMSHDMLPMYYNSLDLFVLPSYFEGFGCVYTEAIACGVPFIGCYNQGYSEYLSDDDKKLWLIEPNDYKQLSVLIKRQMTYPIKQSLINSYDIDALIKEYLNYIAQI